MNKTQIKQNNIFSSNLINSIYQEMHISPEDILKQYAMSAIYGKMNKYESEAKFFENKYKCTFKQFEKRLKKMKNEENFEWEDDLMDWKFAVNSLSYWRSKLVGIENQ